MALISKAIKIKVEHEREAALAQYRKMSLRDLLIIRFNGEYVAGIIEEVIFEKVSEYEDIQPDEGR